jgi:hypothetical protein
MINEVPWWGWLLISLFGYTVCFLLAVIINEYLTGRFPTNKFIKASPCASKAWGAWIFWPIILVFTLPWATAEAIGRSGEYFRELGSGHREMETVRQREMRKQLS